MLTPFKQLIEDNKRDIFAFIIEHRNDCTDEDWWITFSPEIELQFTLNDDKTAYNYGKTEVWAYAVIDGEIQTAEAGLCSLMYALPQKNNRNTVKIA